MNACAGSSPRIRASLTATRSMVWRSACWSRYRLYSSTSGSSGMADRSVYRTKIAATSSDRRRFARPGRIPCDAGSILATHRHSGAVDRLAGAIGEPHRRRRPRMPRRAKNPRNASASGVDQGGIVRGRTVGHRYDAPSISRSQAEVHVSREIRVSGLGVLRALKSDFMIAPPARLTRPSRCRLAARQSESTGHDRNRRPERPLRRFPGGAGRVVPGGRGRGVRPGRRVRARARPRC